METLLMSFRGEKNIYYLCKEICNTDPSQCENKLDKYYL